MSLRTSPVLREHPDRIRWNARHEQAGVAGAPFTPARWLIDVLKIGVPEGPVLELASGRSGTALALAARGRWVTTVDVSDTALIQLQNEAVRGGLADRLTLVRNDATGGQRRRATWSLNPGQPATELPSGFTVIQEVEMASGLEPSRSMIAQRSPRRDG